MLMKSALATRDELDAGQSHLAQHAGAGIHAHEPARGPDDLQRLARDQAGADADIEHLHAGAQVRALQRTAAVPGAAAEGEHVFDAVVVRRGAVEDAAHPAVALVFVGVILRERRVRCEHGGAVLGRRCRHGTRA
jgi:hypothetical protein